jgi:hypothetical protein
VINIAFENNCSAIITWKEEKCPVLCMKKLNQLHEKKKKYFINLAAQLNDGKLTFIQY